MYEVLEIVDFVAPPQEIVNVKIPKIINIPLISFILYVKMFKRGQKMLRWGETIFLFLLSFVLAYAQVDATDTPSKLVCGAAKYVYYIFLLASFVLPPGLAGYSIFETISRWREGRFGWGFLLAVMGIFVFPIILFVVLDFIAGKINNFATDCYNITTNF